MPTFRAVDEVDLEALVDYVIYLSVRGEFERRLLGDAVDELGYEGERPEAELSFRSVLDAEEDASVAAELAVERLQQIVGRWVQAEQRVIAVPEREPPRDAASVERGRELFHGEIVKCVGCHGVEGNGRAILVDFDDWTKEYTTRLSITPWNREALRPFRRAGALRPRPAEPRRLADGVFRGGADSETLYRRLVAGITGTPMPGVITSREPSATGLTSQQVWDLVHYVQSLGEVPR
jgi:mono/diheme cytochrome c family protein